MIGKLVSFNLLKCGEAENFHYLFENGLRSKIVFALVGNLKSRLRLSTIHSSWMWYKRIEMLSHIFISCMLNQSMIYVSNNLSQN